jgi:hypothetical protein
MHAHLGKKCVEAMDLLLLLNEGVILSSTAPTALVFTMEMELAKL